MILLQGKYTAEKQFSLNLPDGEADEYVMDVTRRNPRLLHELVAQNPMVATRCFHWTVRLVIKLLFNCADKPAANKDNIAAGEVPGVFGHVRAYLGVVEPQMRKALHIHMLVQLLGFAHPDDIIGSEVLPVVFRRVWYYVASICFRSPEAFAQYLNEPAAMEALREQPLLPLTKKQRGMIGEVRVREAQQAQLRARGLEAAVDMLECKQQMSYFPSAVHGDDQINASTWARSVVADVATATRKTGNHVCRPDVCHKGRIGRRGFCRMYYWHWARCEHAKKETVSKMMHGLQLHPRWDGFGTPPLCKSPPFLGLPALETTHPFHFKMTPSMLLGPKCNHDLGVLLRLVDVDSKENDIKRVTNSLLDAIGDHEYYCASYASKHQPHMEGLITTLMDGLRAKELDTFVVEEGTFCVPCSIFRSGRVDVIRKVIRCSVSRNCVRFSFDQTCSLRPCWYSNSHSFLRTLCWATCIQRSRKGLNV